MKFSNSQNLRFKKFNSEKFGANPINQTDVDQDMNNLVEQITQDEREATKIRKETKEAPSKSDHNLNLHGGADSQNNRRDPITTADPPEMCAASWDANNASLNNSIGSSWQDRDGLSEKEHVAELDAQLKGFDRQNSIFSGDAQ